MPDLGALSSMTIGVRTFLLCSVAVLASTDVAHGQVAPANPVLSSGQVLSGTTGGQVPFGTPSATGTYSSQIPGSAIVQSGGPGSSTAGVSQVLSVPVITATPPRQIALLATAAVDYDSNVTRTNGLRPLAAGRTKGDFYFPLGGSVDIVIPTGRNIFSLNGSGTYNSYLHDSYLSSEDINLNGGYRRDLHPCDVAATGSYRRGRTDFSHSDLLDLTKNIQSTSIVGATVSCGSQAGIRPYASVSYSVARNAELTRRFNDHNNVVYGGGVTLTSASIGTIGFIGSLSQNEYPERPASGIGGSRDIHVKSIGGSFQRATARILQASLQLNYTIVGRTATSRGFHGLSGTASVQFAPGGRLVFNALVSRSVETSLAVNAAYVLDTDYSLTASTAVSPRLRLSLVFTRQEETYVGVPATVVHILTKDVNQQFGGNAVYVLSPRIRFDFGVSYHDRSANDPIFNFSGIRLSAAVGVRI